VQVLPPHQFGESVRDSAAHPQMVERVRAGLATATAERVGADYGSRKVGTRRNEGRPSVRAGLAAAATEHVTDR
jgi:hypothetical protein